ncbi:AraC family transcriptional regulator [Pseudomonas sp. RIT-PI-AD]|uniref:AraC family transcriptional regulator n=1 Tax=Pseudomonas sp. RIT-PI-AD TaxID=3035294 RepID=UPI0021D835BF|nr:AraC family transcriptional regulator [Pseudomonas sp. RIT-PI-AD]
MPKLIGLYRGSELEIVRIRAGDSDAFPKHTHDEYVISANLSGCESVWLDGRQFEVRPGEVTAYNPHALQASSYTCARAPVEFISLYLSEALVRGVAEEEGLLHGAHALEMQQPLQRDARLCQLIVEMEQLGRQGHDDALHALLHELVGRLLGGSRHEAAALPTLPGGRGLLLTDYLREHLSRPVSLDELASVGGISKFHLLRAFRAQTGLTPGKYHMQLRLLEAKRRLRAGQDIQDVVFDLGFYDQSHFSNAFRKCVGASPKRFARPTWPAVGLGG